MSGILFLFCLQFLFKMLMTLVEYKIYLKHLLIKQTNKQQQQQLNK